MSIYEHETLFAGKHVLPWEPETGIKNPDNTIYRIGLDFDDDVTWTDMFADFIRDPAAGQVTGIVVGQWISDIGEGGNSTQVVEALVSASDKLPNLTAIFLGDITGEENEISWINQADVSPLFIAYPDLQIFRVRGGNGLTFGTLRHARLKTLIVETGGMDAGIVREILDAELPELDHLELWLGTDGYGGNTTVPDLAPLFTGRPFPKLRYLGLRDSEIANDIAVAIAQSPLLERIRVLDLSLGLLDDTGVLALLNNPALLKLEELDIHHHYCTQEMTRKLYSTLNAAGVRVDIDQPMLGRHGGDNDRFVAVSE